MNMKVEENSSVRSSDLSKTVIFSSEINILILLAGTTDPVNMSGPDSARAKSYGAGGKFYSASQVVNRATGTIDRILCGNEAQVGEGFLDDSHYWGGVESVEFREGINDIASPNASGTTGKKFKLFALHGWDGNNNVQSRKTAGHFLVKRLCTEISKGLPAYYDGLLNSHVSLHLLGHSHGGNVINEMTIAMDELQASGKWPVKWKLKSIVYLSTPFFNTMHRPVTNPSVCHEKFKLLNVYNRFDMTQRFIADFSLFSLDSLTSLGRLANPTLNAKTLTKIIEDIKSFDSDLVRSAFEKGLKKYASDSGQKILDDSLKNYLYVLKILEKISPSNARPVVAKISGGNKEEAIAVYGEFMSLFENIRNAIFQCSYIVEHLNKSIKIEIPKEILSLNPGLKKTRIIIDDQLRSKFDKLFYRLLSGVEVLRLKFSSRKTSWLMLDIDSEEYSFENFIRDLELKPLIDVLIEALDINPDTFKSVSPFGFFDLIVEFLSNNIEVFDNTRADPSKFFDKSLIEELDVSERDHYNETLNVSLHNEDALVYDKNDERTLNVKSSVSTKVKRFVPKDSGGNAWLKNYDAFARELERIESNFPNGEKRLDSAGLVEFVVTLLCHEPAVMENMDQLHESLFGTGGWSARSFLHLLKLRSSFISGKDNNRVVDLINIVGKAADVFWNLSSAFKKNYKGSIKKASLDADVTLEHLAVVSHSVSRFKLHKEVKDFLLSQKKAI